MKKGIFTMMVATMPLFGMETKKGIEITRKASQKFIDTSSIHSSKLPAQLSSSWPHKSNVSDVIKRYEQLKEKREKNDTAIESPSKSRPPRKLSRATRSSSSFNLSKERFFGGDEAEENKEPDPEIENIITSVDTLRLKKTAKEYKETARTISGEMQEISQQIKIIKKYLNTLELQEEKLEEEEKEIESRLKKLKKVYKLREQLKKQLQDKDNQEE
jgi:hypothetical protein